MNKFSIFRTVFTVLRDKIGRKTQISVMTNTDNTTVVTPKGMLTSITPQEDTALSLLLSTGETASIPSSERYTTGEISSIYNTESLQGSEFSLYGNISEQNYILFKESKVKLNQAGINLTKNIANQFDAITTDIDGQFAQLFSTLQPMADAFTALAAQAVLAPINTQLTAAAASLTAAKAQMTTIQNSFTEAITALTQEYNSATISS